MYQEPRIALACALFGYGRAGSIVRFLESLPMGAILEGGQGVTGEMLSPYRFQTQEDVHQALLTLSRIEAGDTLEALFLEGYQKEHSVMEGLAHLISALEQYNRYRSAGYRFWLGAVPPLGKTKGVSPYKRWHMFLRWMVRCDALDMGLWKSVEKHHLWMPLDTHTFHVSRKLGLLERKTYDLESSRLLTEKLRSIDPHDPVRFDFALYRIGQERRL